MNKTVNMNLGGLFFHIDEKAYQKLKHYLDAVSHSLNDDPQEKEEIIHDIEQRIGELLSEKISNSQQVISEKNIDEVISIMGQPEDYGFDDELFNEPTKKQSKKRNHEGRKMFRDGKDKILGGVASGLGYYFGIDSAWIRIGLVVATLLGLGTGVLVYIILWIVLPEAITTAEQLQMKGEPVNIDNIEKKIKEEYSKIEEKVKNADYSKVQSFFQDIIEMLGKLLGGLFKVSAKIIGVILLVIASVVLISGLFGLVSVGSFEILGFSDQYIHLPPFMEDSLMPKGFSVIVLLLAVGIPFIFLFVLGLNILSKEKRILGTTANLSLLGIWLLSIFGVAYSGIAYGTKYSSNGKITINKEYAVDNPKDTLFISMKANNKLSNLKNPFRRSSKTELVLDSLQNEKVFSSNVSLDIRRSTDDKILIKTIKSARAYNHDLAVEKAEMIDYHYSLANNTLLLNAFLLGETEIEKHSPKAQIIVYLPKNMTVSFDKTSKYFISNIQNKEDIYDTEMIKHYFTMGDTELECTDCVTKPKKNGVNFKIDKNGVDFFIKDGKDSTKVKIDTKGIEIR